MTTRRPLLAAVAAVALTLALSGCTLVQTLSAPPTTPTATQAPDITTSGTGKPEPTSTETPPGASVGPPVEQSDVALPIGQAMPVEGRAKNRVGTITVDAVTVGYEGCAVAPEVGQVVEITFTVAADAALAAEDDGTDYDREFKLFLADLYSTNGKRLSTELAFDCVRISGWIPSIEPGKSATGSIYLAAPALPEQFDVRWNYGHQSFVTHVA